MGRKTVSAEPEKPHRLSLAELAAHDDACSDAMVDNAYFKSQIRKNRTKYNPLRGIKEDEVPQILLHKVIVGKDPAIAEKALLQLAGIKRYRSTLRSKAERENFIKHLRKYIDMYQTDCPWEVSTTNRYTITTYEAAVTSRQRIKQGQVIKYLVGTLVPLTPEESVDLDLTNRNFSIVVSSRKKNSSIFLGPARFANHDCDANGRLVTRGNDGMEVVAVKNIEVGDEITVSYGDDYFGPGNMDCLCYTCEKLVRNGWTSARDSSSSPRDSVQSSQEPATPEPSRLKRKRESELLSGGNTPLRPSKLSKTKPSPSKLQHSWTPPTSADSDHAESGQEEAAETSQLPHRSFTSQTATGPALSPPISSSSETTGVSTRRRTSAIEKSKDDSVLDEPAAKLSKTENSKKEPALGKSTTRFPRNSQISKQRPSLQAEPELSQDELHTDFVGETITIKVESVETSKTETDPQAMKPTGIPSPDSDSDAVQPKVRSTLITTEVSQTSVTPENVTNAIIPSIEPMATTRTTTTATLIVQPLLAQVRTPGDYLLTRKLLAQPHDRWVQCHNERCLGFFIQPNGYQTRRECPRCERHSMLYGFSWPKTDPDPRKVMAKNVGSPGSGMRGRKKKGQQNERSAYKRAGKCGKGSWVEGGGDEEERVMDHRIVHRFVLAEDERNITRKGLLKMAETARLRGEEVESNGGVWERRDAFGIGRMDSVGLGMDGLWESAVGMTSAGGGGSGRGSLTPDGEARRRSNRFVTRVGVYES